MEEISVEKKKLTKINKIGMGIEICIEVPNPTIHTFTHCIWFPLKSSTKWKGTPSFRRRYAYIAFWSHFEALSEIP